METKNRPAKTKIALSATTAPADLEEAPPRTGTQSIERVVGMLRVVASRGRRGMRIADVVSVSGLPMSTCFRMLQRLELEGLVSRDALTRKYHLGPLLYELGMLAQPRYRLSELCEQALHTIAEQTQDTVYLSERRGAESICTSRALGDYPIKALTLDVGIRRPMGVGAGGLAILSALPQAETEQIVEANGARYAKFGAFDPGFLHAAIAETRARGYSFLDSAATPGSAAVGVAFPPDNPIAAVSVAAISARLGPKRRAEVARIIQQQVLAICALLPSTAVAGATPSARRKAG
ncbi:DNA-binding IclR family transcriptional regulator [Variovorax boronicumulans]|uniref:DNA-binding IclR family transcriptional regulator n=1 Tax=Variovorax boronicumulans TaxID=436515 RepID=A0AAW8DUJ8_9BURK|nr:IclR family transcriptional regulator [Variovorax boronicumulans]MDP9877708.1 DNA-binding IclR family transcriptional regulator [Variovorax boronicumulans]MDP9922992.1 DNA-binding IclR family transcriptional regulator [Variovorax boronicumulans]